MARQKEEEKILDVNAAMQGSLVFSDPVNLRINGKFEGNLNTKGKLTVGQSAEIRADIIGENITVGGSIKGNIKATEVVKLLSTAQVVGNIEVPKIAIEQGAIFNGKCRTAEARISLEELSDYLSVEEKKIIEWVEGGKIPVEKEGNKLLFDRREVENWVGNKP